MLKDIQFELDIVKASSTVKSGDRVICGYASTFDVDTDEVQITRTALEKAKDNLLKYSTVLFNHDTDRPIGKIVETSVDDIGLFIKMILSKTEDEIWSKVKEGIISKFSIKGRAANPVRTEGSGSSHLTQINEIELFEVSLVTVPGNVEAQTICHYIVKSLKKSQKKSQESSNNIMLIKKLNELLKKKDGNLRKDISNFLEEVEKQKEEKEDLYLKLQVIAGKLNSEDKEVIENIIDLLKKKDEDDDSQKSFDFADESEDRPVYQLSSESDMVLEEGSSSKFKKQILKLGNWFHWDADKGVLKITDETIDNIIKNFKKKLIENVYVPLTHTKDPSKNVGEIIKLKKTDEGLDAVIEIKDKSIAEKIKKGLIKCISASLDSNYRVKKTNKFAGPTLLHAALVSEPYIKGMGSFVQMSEEYADRQIIQLEDEEPNFNSLYKSFEENMKKIKGIMLTEDKVNEIFFDLQKKKVEITKKEGDSCTTESDEKGKLVDVDGTLVCKVFTKKENDDIARNAYTDCVGKQMKEGKTMAEAAKTCKVKIKKELGYDVPEEEPEVKSGNSSGEVLNKNKTSGEVDLADAEKAYEKYLEAGKIVPAQKEAFMKLYQSGKVLELSDNKVDTTQLLELFMKGQPKIVSLNEENGTQGNEPVTETGKGGDNEDPMPEDVKTLYGKMGLSDEGAEESWRYAVKMKKLETEENESTIF